MKTNKEMMGHMFFLALAMASGDGRSSGKGKAVEEWSGK